MSGRQDGMGYTRRAFLSMGGAAVLLASASRPVRAALPELTIWGPPAGPSITLIYAIVSGGLSGIADKVTFKSWRSADELRAGLASRTMDIFILSTHNAANLFNRGLDVRLLNVMTNGLLYVVSSDEKLASIPELRGRSVAVPYRNDTPDVIFRHLLVRHGLDPDTDVTQHFTGSPMESVQMLLTGRVSAILLPEPAVTAALMNGAKNGHPLFRVIDIQKAWGEATGLAPILPQAGLGVTGRFLAAHPAVLDGLQNGLADAVALVNARPEQAAADTARTMGFPIPVTAAAIPHSNLVATRAAAARPALEAVYTTLADYDAGIIGGALPPPAFYL